jgi:aconitate hydratase
LSLIIHRPGGKTDTVPVICRIDTADEVKYYLNGGILQYVLRGMAKAA